METSFLCIQLIRNIFSSSSTVLMQFDQWIVVNHKLKIFIAGRHLATKMIRKKRKTINRRKKQETRKSNEIDELMFSNKSAVWWNWAAISPHVFFSHNSLSNWKYTNQIMKSKQKLTLQTSDFIRINYLFN